MGNDSDSPRPAAEDDFFRAAEAGDGDHLEVVEDSKETAVGPGVEATWTGRGRGWLRGVRFQKKAHKWHFWIPEGGEVVEWVFSLHHTRMLYRFGGGDLTLLAPRVFCLDDAILFAQGYAAGVLRGVDK